MRAIYYGDSVTTDKPFIFLAGPTHRTPGQGWRQEALDLLGLFKGTVVLPEWKHGTHEENKRARGWTSRDVVGWESRHLNAATVILFWMPFCLGTESDPASLPGFTTRLELGIWLQREPGKLVVGMPRETALAVGAIRYYCEAQRVPLFSSLAATVEAAIFSLEKRLCR